MKNGRIKKSVLLTALAASAAVVIICVIVVSVVSLLHGAEDDKVIILDGSESVAQIPDRVELGEDEELRAVWIPYMSTQNITREKIDVMVDRCRELGANAIIFHVRAFGDALYPSQYFPRSHFQTGTQGVEPADGFDPLGYMVERAHANGMQLHAWVNPLRIQLEGGHTPEVLADSNPYMKWRNDGIPFNDHWVVDYNGGKFYNPGVPEVRDLISNGVAELAANYNIDGVHWDDYFYPAEDESFDDSVAYGRYLADGGSLSLREWRTENINTLVKDCYNKVKAADGQCVFGISPAGNIENCLAAGADIYKWGSTPGYVDYLCPQIYWTFSSTVAPFDGRCADWRALVTSDSVKLYVGLALYKAGSDADGGKWLASERNIADQIEYIRSNGIDADGFMIYSYEYLDAEQTAAEVGHIREALS